ncbi:YggS family pyridoxal phosphate-dependent enzyme, partial [Micromonospora globispora]
AEVREWFRGRHPEATALSAGMSGDLEIAIGYGATHVRVGSALLGMRPTLR